MSDVLNISVSDDKLTAWLFVPANSQPEIAHIAHLVSEHGICFGLKSEAIQEACALCNTDRDICIAEGQKPSESQSSTVRKAINSEQQKVKQGDYLGELVDNSTGNIDGIDVFGKRVPASRKNAMLCLGEGVEIANHKIYAARDGIFLVDSHNCYKVIDECTETAIAVSNIEVLVSEDRMQAHITLQESEYVESPQLAQAVQAANISFGLRNSGLHDAITAVQTERSITIAKGSPPKHGDNAYLEYFIDDRLTFAKDENGNFDFKASSLHKSVKKGAILARLHPASKGTAGMDILGNRIDCKDGQDKEAEEFLNEGTAISSEDPMLIIADRDGIYQKDGSGSVGVLELLEINGDVDMSVGNIETPYPVIVHGDIKEGFQVKSGSDITVDGLIEDARVSAGGNITVAKGILPGQNRVKARGDIAALYIRERESKAHSVYVSKSIRRASIFANADVTAAEILGGEVHAGCKIEVERLGTDSGHRTEAKVGIDPYINSLLLTAKEEHKAQHEIAKRLEPQVESTSKRAQDLGHKFKSLASSGQQNASYLEQLRKQAKRALDESVKLSDEYRAACHQLNIIAQNIALYQEQLRELQGQSSIEISDTVFPPVKIQIGPDAHYKVQAPITNLSFILDKKGDIQLVRHRSDQSEQDDS